MTTLESWKKFWEGELEVTIEDMFREQNERDSKELKEYFNNLIDRVEDNLDEAEFESWSNRDDDSFHRMAEAKKLK